MTWISSRSRVLGGGLALAALATACGRGSTVTPQATPTPVPTVSGGGGIPTSACATSAYAAYEPDGGNGAGFTGIQVVHYADTRGDLCAAPGPVPSALAFAGSVGPFTERTDGSGTSDALAVIGPGTGAYHLVQDVLNLGIGAPIPAGAPYDFAVLPPAPTPLPSVSPVPSPTSTVPPPLLSDVTSISILLSSFNSAASAVGLATAPNSSAVVAVTSLSNAPPLYGGSVFYNPPAGTVGNKITPTVAARSTIVAAPDGSSVVARGPADLLLYQVPVPYQLIAVAENTSLGTNGVVLRGFGNVAYDPRDTRRLLVAGTSGGATAHLTLLTGLPTALTVAGSIDVPGSVNSLVIDRSGTYAYVATNAGIVAVKGIDTGSLALATISGAPSSGNATQLPYIDCNGRATSLSNVFAVRLSSLDRQLVALGTSPGTACAGGYNASVVAAAFTASTATIAVPSPAPSATAAPATFTQNNVIPPPLGADYFVVR